MPGPRWPVRRVPRRTGLKEVAADHIPDGVTFKTVARHGKLYEEVLEVAKELDVDHIVIGALMPAGTCQMR